MPKNVVKFPKVAGTSDVLPRDQDMFDYYYSRLEKISNSYGFDKMQMPVVENKKVHKLISKEFKGKKSIQVGTGNLVGILRADMALSVLRAYLDNDMTKNPHPVRLYTSGKQYYIEGSNSKEYKESQVSQFEVVGEDKAIVDAMNVQIISEILHDLKIKKPILLLNSLGDKESRDAYEKALLRYLKLNSEGLCKECKGNLSKDVYDILECQKNKCRKVFEEAPLIEDYYTEEAAKYFESLKGYLDEGEINYIIDRSILNGSGFYSGPVFKIKYGDRTLARGGRHDDLLKELGGKRNAASGVTIYDDEIIRIMKEEDLTPPKKKKDVIFLAHLGERAKAKGFKVFREMIRSGLNVREALVKNTLRSQLITADKLRAKWLLIIGQKEAVENTTIIKEVSSGIQEVVTNDLLIKNIKQRMKSL